MKIRLTQKVRVDGVDLEPGVHNVSAGYAESVIAAGWATPVKGSDKADIDADDANDADLDANDADLDADDADPDADDAPAGSITPPAAPKRKRPAKKAAKRS